MIDVYLPTSLDEVWDVLDEHPRARMYSGGTDVLVQMRRGRIRPNCLVCLERVTELQRIDETDDDIHIGAGCTHGKIQHDPSTERHCAVLVHALETLASPPIRHMGTIGGNIVNASPAGDTIPPLMVLEAQVELRRRSGTRAISIAEFIKGPGVTDIRPGEVLTRVIVPKRPRFMIHHFEKVGRRKAQACAIASLAAVMNLSLSGSIQDIRIAWGSLGPTVVRANEVEDALRGQRLDNDNLNAVVPLLERSVCPIDDVRASAHYRRVVAGNLLVRLLRYAGDNTFSILASRSPEVP